MNLDLALGITCKNSSSLTTDNTTGNVAYPTAGVVVVFDPKVNRQVAFIHNKKNAVSCVCFSPDGKHLATGEIGYKPAVRVWRMQTDKEPQEVGTFFGHEYGIKSVVFSPKGDMIVSVGLENDNSVFAWSWPAGFKIGTNNIKDIIHSTRFSQCGTFFVTAGVRHIKYWYPGLTRSIAESTTVPTVVPLYVVRVFSVNTKTIHLSTVVLVTKVVVILLISSQKEKLLLFYLLTHEASLK